jgi:hypothetical protein
MDRKTPRNSTTKEQRMRQQLAQEAARLMAEEGIADFNTAKQKAAARLHAPHTHSLPRNDEIQQALIEYQRLFQSATQPRSLLHLRQTALKAMRFFKQFEPRLAGAVADGTASEFSIITLHLFTDASEELHIFLLNQRIPHELGSQRFTLANEQSVEQPVYEMDLEGCALELIVFERNGIRQAPRDPVTRRPMQRLSIEKVEALIQLTGPAQPTI